MGALDAFLGPLQRLVETRIRLGSEGSAQLCSYDHVPIYTGPDPSRYSNPMHIDVTLRLWNRGHVDFALLEGQEAKAAGQALEGGNFTHTSGFRGATLRAGEQPVEVHFSLRGPNGAPVVAKPGQKVEIRLRPTRGRRKVLHVPIVGLEVPDS